MAGICGWGSSGSGSWAETGSRRSCWSSRSTAARARG